MAALSGLTNETFEPGLQQFLVNATVGPIAQRKQQ
jgi:hypothetical protein